MNDEIREYLLSHGANEDVGEIADGDSLLELGVVDSMAMVDLIAHIETTYGIVVDEDDMTPENFDSIEAIVAYVGQKREEALSAANSAATTE